MDPTNTSRNSTIAASRCSKFALYVLVLLREDFMIVSY